MTFQMEKLSKQNADLALLISGFHDVSNTYMNWYVVNEEDHNAV